MPKVGRNWECDVCGEDADLHTTEGVHEKKGEHEYFCRECYYKHQC